MTGRQIKSELHRIAGILAALPADERAARYEEELALLPPDCQDAAAAFLTVAVVMGYSKHTKKASAGTLPLWEKICLYSIGVLMVGGMVAYSIVIPSPTPQQEFVMRLVLAIGGAGIGAFIPGFLHVDGKIQSFTLRAGGALGMFVVIFLVNPPALVPEKKKTARSEQQETEVLATPATLTDLVSDKSP